mmetsp:Transcript_24961/g.85415  ORF Transcript_24961/g.85415 Transcript_24961/m.85415 type:complete len:1236 (+) Transcript_24961:1403-5110(+)
MPCNSLCFGPLGLLSGMLTSERTRAQLEVQGIAVLSPTELCTSLFSVLWHLLYTYSTVPPPLVIVARLAQSLTSFTSEYSCIEVCETRSAIHDSKRVTLKSGHYIRTTKQIVTHAIQFACDAFFGACIEPNEPLLDAGLDSLAAIEFPKILGKTLGVLLPVGLVLDYPTLHSIQTYILTLIDETSKSLGSTTHIPSPSSAHSIARDKVALCNLVLGASSAEPHKLIGDDLKYATDAVSRVPINRWSNDRDTPQVKFGVFLSCFGIIDARVFHLSKSEASIMNYQQLQVLKEAFAALASNKNVGGGHSMLTDGSVYVGVTKGPKGSSASLSLLLKHKKIYEATSSMPSVVSGRLSYVFGLTGAAVSIDTACSSALVALNIASQHSAKLDWLNQTKYFNMTIGVQLVDADGTQMCARAGMLSRDGRCKTLDICADGYVRGEACEVALLGEASAVPPAALAAPGSAVNQDGRSSSLTAPNGPAQQRVVAAALALARASPSQVASLHMHGTGTALGDPVEAAAACEVLCTKPRASAASTAGRLPLQLAAGKSYVGHSECAAGLTGALLAVLGVEHHSSRSVLHLRAVNTHVAAAVGAVSRASVLPRECSALRFGSEAGASVYAGVSSFAFQGTNAHAVVSGKCGAACRGLARTAAATRASQVQRCWVVCEAAMLAERVLSWCTSAGAATLVSELGTPIHAALRDHRVQGRALCAGAALLECASAGCESLCSEDAAVGAARVLKDGILPVPLVLHEGAESRVELLCSVADTSTQFVEVRSARAEQRQVHLAASTCWQGARGLASGLVATKKRFCCFSITSFFDCYTIASMCFSAHFGFGAEGCLSLSCTDIDCLSFTHNHTTDGNNDTFAWIFDFPYTLYQSVMVFASFTTKLTIHTKTCKKSSTTKTFLEKNTLAGESFRSLPLCDLFSDRNYFASYASSLDLFHQLNYRCKFSTINQNGHSISCLQKKMQTVITLHSSPILEDSQRYNFAGRRAAAIFCILQTRPFLGMNRKVRVRLSAPRLVNCGDSLLKVLSTWSKEVSEVCLDKCAHLGATTPFICRPMPAEHTCAQPFAEGSAAYEARAVLSTIYYTTRRDKHLFNFPVITGGLGAVGGIISKWITQAYKDVKRVLLLSSTASTKAKLKSLAEYGAYAPAVSQLLIDVGTAGEQELRHIKKFGAINLFHASGILRDAASWNTTPALLTKLHAPKALGAQRLCCALFGSRVNSLIHFFTCSYNRS